MLEITIPAREVFDEKNNEFLTFREETLRMEHSLLSLSKWESKWKKPFLTNEPKSREELLDYFRCMTINTEPSANFFASMDLPTIKKIEEYIGDSHTATKIYDRRQTANRRNETITSELIYYWMIEYGIPFECQKWHLNRLLTLIKVCGIKQGPDRKMSRQSIYAQNKALNESRRRALHSRG